MPSNLTKEIAKDEDASNLWHEEHSLMHDESSMSELRCELVKRM